MCCSDIVIIVLAMGFIISWYKLPGIAAKTETLPRKCQRPPRYGSCKELFQNFYYDPKGSMCRTFLYSGCGGNRNNFPTLVECIYECEKFDLRTSWLNLAGDAQWKRDTAPKCRLRRRIGWCRSKLPRYYYDYKNQRCRPFIYSGCRGNENNFASYRECAVACEPFGNIDYSKLPQWNPETMRDTCELPIDVGPCSANFLRFYYDAKTKTCKPFSFGGCNGNNNNFVTLQDCIRECRRPGAEEEEIKNVCDEVQEEMDHTPKWDCLVILGDLMASGTRAESDSGER
ncbi:actinia tenebrosa protease inhibitors-like [Sceloporus undulatus]|uniref:actinia tenebrosa protease inhibitors-like n=1 Tax=Sceloporus undulatus TaxID=8520 RepID=UPI001C4D18DF|nr:actinia tenebrosa protease inhibitors-like [Sceloporus undulatus]